MVRSNVLYFNILSWLSATRWYCTTSSTVRLWQTDTKHKYVHFCPWCTSILLLSVINLSTEMILKKFWLKAEMIPRCSNIWGSMIGRVLPEAAWPTRWVTPVLCSGCGAPLAAPPALHSGSSRLQEPPGPPAPAKPTAGLPLACRSTSARDPEPG